MARKKRTRGSKKKVARRATRGLAGMATASLQAELDRRREMLEDRREQLLEELDEIEEEMAEFEGEPQRRGPGRPPKKKKKRVGRPAKKKKRVGRPAKKKRRGRPAKKKRVGRPAKKKRRGRPAKKKRVGRPSKKTTRKKTSRRGKKRGRRARNQGSLVESLKRLLANRTMNVTEIAEAVQKAGYKTTSPNFRTIVNQTLINNKKDFKRVARGQYTAK